MMEETIKFETIHIASAPAAVLRVEDRSCGTESKASGHVSSDESFRFQQLLESEDSQESKISSGESQAFATGRPLRGPVFEESKDSGPTVDVSDLVDTSAVIEVEKLDFSALPRKHVYFFAKRLFDIVACSIALVLLVIPMCIIAVLIKLDSPGPVFYRQERLGKGGCRSCC